MKTTTKLFAIVVGAALTQGCKDDHAYCGDGTTAVDGYCEGSGGDCGPGTHEEDGQCVLDEDVVICGDGTTEVDGECVAITETGLPPVIEDVSSPTPYPGGGVLVIHGDNFMLSDSGATTVTIGGVDATNVQVLSNNYVLADLPLATAVTVEVALTNDLGSDAADFTYVGLYAAEGGCSGGGKLVLDAPQLFLVDPLNGTELAIGPITSDGDTVARPVAAMRFAADGTLWAVEAVCYGTSASLMTIDRDTGAATVVATVVVPAFVPPTLLGVAPPTRAAITDLVFVDATLYGRADGRDNLVTIDTSTGAVTVLETTSAGGDGGALTTASDGSFLFSGYGYTIDVLGSDGTYVGYDDVDSPGMSYFSAFTWFDGSLYASGGDGYQGIARFDPAQDAFVHRVGGRVYDALTTPPELDGTPGDPPELEPATRPAQVSVIDPFSPLGVQPRLDGRGRRSADLSALGLDGAITIHAETGDLTLPGAAGYQLVENKHGRLKLVDAEGATVLRRITSIE